VDLTVLLGIRVLGVKIGDSTAITHLQTEISQYKIKDQAHMDPRILGLPIMIVAKDLSIKLHWIDRTVT
jgi:hypothetical protein